MHGIGIQVDAISPFDLNVFELRIHAKKDLKAKLFKNLLLKTNNLSNSFRITINILYMGFCII